MTAIKHEIKHYYQPTNMSCSQASLAMLFSHFGQTMTPEEIIDAVPVNVNEAGEELGTLNQELATWCLSQGYQVAMHTADFQIIDLAWAKLPVDQLLKRMELAKAERDVPKLGKAMSTRYMQSYIDFINAGGNLRIEPFMTEELLDELLANSPIIVAVCYAVLHQTGRVINTGLREVAPDDIEGSVGTHSVVVYGKNEQGNYHVADPWQKPGHHIVEPRLLLASMDAAQIECDNILFQLTKK